MVMHAVQYSRMMEALQHSWKGLKRRETKELIPAVVFTVMGNVDTRNYVDAHCKRAFYD